MTPLEFLTLLWQDKPEQFYILIWMWSGMRSRWFREIPAAASYVDTVLNNDVYVGVGLSKRDCGPTHRCEAKDIGGITGLWADIDLRSSAHASKTLPATIAQALSIVPASMPPTIVIRTGNGLHCWWLFKEPFIFESDEDRRESARLSERWSTLLRLNAANCGWGFDRLSDLSRILRIPGTRNCKEANQHKDVTLHSFDDATRYNQSDFAEFLDDSGIPDAETRESVAREWAAQFADKPSMAIGPLVINQSARLPQELITGWTDVDMRFKNTWLKQRHDLKDQSQSGYDLALADFGVEAGLAPQQIVDLIVHHRHLHGEKRQRNRPDYYQRTILKAAKQCDWRKELSEGGDAPSLAGPSIATRAPEPPEAPEAPKASKNGSRAIAAPAAAQGAPKGGGTSDGATPDPAAAKALLCEQVSAVIGVRVLRMVKLTGKEPIYHMWLEGSSPIEFSVKQILSQVAVREAIVGETNHIMPTIKAKLWREVNQKMLDACFTEQGGEEVEFQGAARMYLTQYLSDTSFIDAVAGQMVQNQRKPMVVDGRIAICSSDLQIYIVRNLLQSHPIRAVVSMIKSLGATRTRVRGAKRRDQDRWILPLEEFDPQEFQHAEVEAEVAADAE